MVLENRPLALGFWPLATINHKRLTTKDTKDTKENLMFYKSLHSRFFASFAAKSFLLLVPYSLFVSFVSFVVNGVGFRLPDSLSPGVNAGIMHLHPVLRLFQRREAELLIES